MNKHKDKYNLSRKDDYKSLDITSATECTGMVPTPPLTDAQTEGLSGVYSVPQKKATQANEDKNVKNEKK